jgi:hypothetical protein
MPSLSKLSSTFASADAQFIFTGGKRFCKKKIQVFFSVFLLKKGRLSELKQHSREV